MARVSDAGSKARKLGFVMCFLEGSYTFQGLGFRVQGLGFSWIEEISFSGYRAFMRGFREPFSLGLVLPNYQTV